MAHDPEDCVFCGAVKPFMRTCDHVCLACGDKLQALGVMVSSKAQCENRTRRELELCRLLADGLSTKEAAEHLAISVKTAETHRARVMKKLRAKNVTDIVKYCIRNGIADI